MILEHKTLDLHGKMVFERAIVKTPFTVGNAMHDEACFLYVLKGKAIAVSENHTQEAMTNEGILMKCGTYFNQMFSDFEDGEYEAIAIHFFPDVLEKVFDHEVPSFLKDSGKKLPLKPSEKLEPDDLFRKFFEGVLFYFSHPELVNEELLTLKLKELLLLLENTKESEKLHQILSSLFSPQTYSFRSIVESHLFNNVSLDELASLAGLSLSSFKRTFKETFKDSPARYIRTKRLELAAELLKTTDLNISEIAYKCAFNDLAHFSSCFKQHHEISPSEYRKS